MNKQKKVILNKWWEAYKHKSIWEYTDKEKVFILKRVKQHSVEDITKDIACIKKYKLYLRDKTWL